LAITPAKPLGPSVLPGIDGFFFNAELRPVRIPILKPDAYLQVVEQACRQRGLRLTPLRAQVLRLVLATGRPIKAYDVLASLSYANGETAPMTAYRALDFLTDHGFIHRLACLSSYVACTSPDNHRAVPFLICETCHAVVEVEFDDQTIFPLLHTLAQVRGFRPRAQSLEVLGECADCSHRHGRS
jgi:Fur family zinc uptake transcriptional regulator